MNNIKKKTYNVPVIDRIKLDNEFSLVLQSIPPVGPGESLSSTPEYFIHEPFKS